MLIRVPSKEGLMRKIFFVAILAALAAVPAESGSQSTSVSAGPTYGFGQGSGWFGPGYNVQAGKEFGHFGPAVFRVDALYLQRSLNGGMGSSITDRTYAATGSLVLRRSIGRVAPFALLGVGLYGDNTWAAYTPGINAGIGIEASIARVRFFTESRIHEYWRDAREAPRLGRRITLVPISIGVRF
jgi:hypothetical protein